MTSLRFAYDQNSPIQGRGTARAACGGGVSAGDAGSENSE